MIAFQNIFPVIVFCFIASVTPGPNNMMLMSSALNHGIKKSIPHYLGIVVGFPVLLLACGMGLHNIFSVMPALYWVVKVLGISYLLYLSWKIANTKRIGATDSLKKPMTFIQAALFQWVNPKAWMISIAIITSFTGPANFQNQFVWVFLACFLSGLVSMWIWLIFGASLKRYLKQNKVQKFNIMMAAILVISVAPLVGAEFPTW